MDEGDRNTKFFHNSTIQNRSLKKITSISTPQGLRTDKPQEIADTIVTYFKNLLNNDEGSNREAQSRMLSYIPKLIIAEDNKTLNRPITLEEVQTVVFNMSPNKSPGPDGFQAFLFLEILGYFMGRFMESDRSLPEWWILTS